MLHFSVLFSSTLLLHCTLEAHIARLLPYMHVITLATRYFADFIMHKNISSVFIYLLFLIKVLYQK